MEPSLAPFTFGSAPTHGGGPQATKSPSPPMGSFNNNDHDFLSPSSRSSLLSPTNGPNSVISPPPQGASGAWGNGPSNGNGNGAAAGLTNGGNGNGAGRPRLGERAGSFQKDKDGETHGNENGSSLGLWGAANGTGAAPFAANQQGPFSPPLSSSATSAAAIPRSFGSTTSARSERNSPPSSMSNADGLPSSAVSTNTATTNPTTNHSTRHGSTGSNTGSAGAAAAINPARAASTLWMGDLESWMDESYVRKCVAMMGWSTASGAPPSPDGSNEGDKSDGEGGVAQTAKEVGIKMIRGASPSSGYCFLTFGTPEHAEAVWRRASSMPPTLMPGSERTFKLNWATGLPGVQPRWDSEFSVFVGDLSREVNEGELVSLFTPLFPSTKSAKIMCDPSTGLSRGYGFVRFGEETDMHRALALGRSSANAASGLSLRGRTIRISEASGSSGTAAGGNSGDSFGSLPNGDHQQGPRRAPSAAPSGADRSDAASPAGGAHRIPAGFSSGRPNLPPLAVPIATSHHYFPGAAPSPTLLSPFGMTPAGGHHAAPAGAFYAPLALSPTAGGFAVAPAQVAALAAAATSNPATDPNNTTVFVGGLPACISEETLKSFFQHFGEITYVKIPPNKGCGFVQFVRRPDAEMAIAKMHDFPIHGKSRIRLSWGRSQGDKQVEHVRKLAAALGVPFDAVWRMVQGQDNSTIKQIASAVGSASNANAAAAAAAQRGREEQLAAAVQAQAAAQAVAQAQAQVLAHAQQHSQQSNNGQQQGRSMADLTSPRSSTSLDPLGGDFFPRSQPALASLDRENAAAAAAAGGAGPYSRVSPSHFAPFSNAATPSASASNLGMQQNQMPLSPPPSASSYGPSSGNNAFSQGGQSAGYHSGGQAGYGPNHSSPYERVEFAQGGLLGRHSAERGYHAAPHHPNSAPPEVSSFAGGMGGSGAGARSGSRGGQAGRGAWDRQQPSYDSMHSMHPVNEADWDAFEGDFGSKLSLGGGQSRGDIQARLTGAAPHQQQQQSHRDDRDHSDGRGFGGRDPFASNAWGSWLETPGMKA